jgi:hypothetical protein
MRSLGKLCMSGKMCVDHLFGFAMWMKWVAATAVSSAQSNDRKLRLAFTLQ